MRVRWSSLDSICCEFSQCSGASFFILDPAGKVAAGEADAHGDATISYPLAFQSLQAGTLCVSGEAESALVRLCLAVCERELSHQLTVVDMAEATARLWRQTNALLRMTESTNLAIEPRAVFDRVLGQLEHSTSLIRGVGLVRAPEAKDYSVFGDAAASTVEPGRLSNLEAVEEAVRLIAGHETDAAVRADCVSVLGDAVTAEQPIAVARLATEKERYGFLLVPALSLERVTSEDLKVLGAAAQILSLAIENGLTLSRERESTRLQVENELLNIQARDMEEMLHVVAHDLRSPMTAMYGFMHLALDQLEELNELLAADKKRGLAAHGNRIVKPLRDGAVSIEKLNRMVQRLLDFSRVARLEYKFEDIDLRELAGEVVRSLGFQLSSKDIDVEIGDLPVVRGDRIHLEAVFSNLIDNAIKYMGSEPPRAILIGCSKGAERVYCVEDTGVGMSPDQVAKAFLPFRRFRSDAAPGEGIGLSYVRKIVERHGGRIWCESKEGLGTKFFFTLGEAGRDLKPPL